MNPVAIYSVVILVLVAVAVLVVFFRRRRLWPQLGRSLDRHTEYIDNLPLTRIGLWIALAAGLGLYAELMIIRVHSSFFQVFAYFKNVSLLSCFLGLGIGYIRGPRRPLLTPLVMPLLMVQTMLMYPLRFSRVADWLHNPITESVAFGFGSASELWHFVTVYGFLLVIFALNAVCFIPLGHLASRLMMRTEKLRSYSWNLIGSLAGIVLFTVLSFAWTPPWVWILIGGLWAVLFVYHRWRHLLPTVAATLLLLIMFAIPSGIDSFDIYSPYQILTVSRSDDGPVEVKACNTFHQHIYDLRQENVTGNARLEHWRLYYGMPYVFKPAPRDVLILGSGTGNDVAAAIRHGAGHIDAVEIDPAIMECGRRWHPEKPYASENVTAIVDDARSFIRRTDKKYDLISYGLLDSHSLLSSASGGVRLDSYVYTVEAFREARAKLKPGGVIALSFCVINEQLGRKLYLMLQEAFEGQLPRVFQANYDASMCFVVGDGVPGGYIKTPENIREITSYFRDRRDTADLSTDDWPFFYMLERQYPVSYVIMIVILCLVSLAFIWRWAPGTGSGFSVPCFFLGAGFMLVETKSITELALVYGNTWIVVSVVIAAILFMAFLANLIIIRYGAPRSWIVYSLLGIALGLGLGVSFINLGFLHPWASRLVLTVLLTLPLFFSGFAFSSELKKSAAVSIALSSNLLGAMLGGFMEYNAMYFGYRSLYLIALVMYAIAFLGSFRSRAVE